jgi:amidase
MGILPDDTELLFRPTGAGISVFELWQVQKRKRDLRQEHLALWEETVSQTGTGRPVDAIISPMAPYTAPPHGLNKYAPVSLEARRSDNMLYQVRAIHNVMELA